MEKRKEKRKVDMAAGRQVWRPGNMLYPLPAVMVSAADKAGNANILTVAWTGTVCSDPAMLYISVRPERYTYHMIRETGEFVVNLTTERLAYATDWCGVRSGRDVDKWRETGLTPGKGSVVEAPIILESPVNVECVVTEVLELGSHHMFLARVKAIQVEESLMDERGRFCFEKAKPLAYSHGVYCGLGEALGSFGYSIRKKTTGTKKKQKKSPGKPV